MWFFFWQIIQEVEEGEIVDSDTNEADSNSAVKGGLQGQKPALLKKKAVVIEELEDGEIVDSSDDGEEQQQTNATEKQKQQQVEEQNEQKRESKPVVKKSVNKTNPVLGSALIKDKKNMENKENHVDKKKKGQYLYNHS